MCDMNKSCAFTNEKCPYYPCHQMSDGENINCLFCLCPLYDYNCSKYGGSPKVICTKGGGIVKDCSNCTFPHEYGNEQKIWDAIRKERF